MNFTATVLVSFIVASSFYTTSCVIPEVIQAERRSTNETYRKVEDKHIIPMSFRFAISTKSTDAECPLWFLYSNTSQCVCGNDLGGILHCDQEQQRVYIINCYCMTQDKQVGTVVGSCATNCEVRKRNTTLWSYHQLPSKVIQLNEVMCGLRWNRSGRFCGKCKDGYYQSVYSYEFGCTKCSDSQLRHNWAKYIAFAFVPLTVFYVLVLILRINASHPSLDGMVIYAQAITTPANVRISLTTVTRHPKVSPFIRLVATLYGIWNLDFFRTVLPSTCLKISTLQALALDYSIAFYPLILVVVTYIFIELHDSGCNLIIWMWKPFGKCFSIFTSRFDIKSSIINAFGTFLLLSYVKLLSVTFDLLVPVWAYDVRGNPVGTYLYYDANIKYLGKNHLPYAILAIFVMVAFIILPILFLIFYPLRCCKFLGRWPTLRICLDTYQGYYKDGTEGTCDCRWYSCMPLIVRILLFVVLSFVKNVYFYLCCICKSTDDSHFDCDKTLQENVCDIQYS